MHGLKSERFREEPQKKLKDSNGSKSGPKRG